MEEKKVRKELTYLTPGNFNSKRKDKYGSKLALFCQLINVVLKKSKPITLSKEKYLWNIRRFFLKKKHITPWKTFPNKISFSNMSKSYVRILKKNIKFFKNPYFREIGLRKKVSFFGSYYKGSTITKYRWVNFKTTDGFLINKFKRKKKYIKNFKRKKKSIKEFWHKKKKYAFKFYNNQLLNQRYLCKKPMVANPKLENKWQKILKKKKSLEFWEELRDKLTRVIHHSKKKLNKKQDRFLKTIKILLKIRIPFLLKNIINDNNRRRYLELFQRYDQFFPKDSLINRIRKLKKKTRYSKVFKIKKMLNRRKNILFKLLTDIKNLEFVIKLKPFLDFKLEKIRLIRKIKTKVFAKQKRFVKNNKLQFLNKKIVRFRTSNWLKMLINDTIWINKIKFFFLKKKKKSLKQRKKNMIINPIKKKHRNIVLGQKQTTKFMVINSIKKKHRKIALGQKQIKKNKKLKILLKKVSISSWRKLKAVLRYTILFRKKKKIKKKPAKKCLRFKQLARINNNLIKKNQLRIFFQQKRRSEKKKKETAMVNWLNDLQKQLFPFLNLGNNKKK